MDREEDTIYIQTAMGEMCYCNLKSQQESVVIFFRGTLKFAYTHTAQQLKMLARSCHIASTQ